MDPTGPPQSSQQWGAASTGDTPRATSPTEPAFTRLKHLITLPESDFPPNNPLHKQIWSVELSTLQVRTLFAIAHTRLERAVKDKRDALEEESEKLDALLTRGMRIPQRADPEDVKGDVCVLVLQRWTYERDLELMRGR
ncbi:hypothetical protein B0A55_07088 [Friedmanniomyces simplex]|uniref:Uncharacterized protein n=1 Tax=Friedmanniomyces simplex TaxID=329884 RepID=A0A4U0XEW6_9PEZI|nr:hypothetical protein B0A55_07088 [Friedmanniomyces simplex]